jgi:hypothetical protein
MTRNQDPTLTADRSIAPVKSPLSTFRALASDRNSSKLAGPTQQIQQRSVIESGDLDDIIGAGGGAIGTIIDSILTNTGSNQGQSQNQGQGQSQGQSQNQGGGYDLSSYGNAGNSGGGQSTTDSNSNTLMIAAGFLGVMVLVGIILAVVVAMKPAGRR